MAGRRSSCQLHTLTPYARTSDQGVHPIDWLPRRIPTFLELCHLIFSLYVPSYDCTAFPFLINWKRIANPSSITVTPSEAELEEVRAEVIHLDLL